MECKSTSSDVITDDLRYTIAMTCSKEITNIDPSIGRMGSFTW